MKIIEELKIGSYERYKSYFETGSPEVFISKKTGFCRYCETKFEFDEGRYYVNNYPVYSRMFCPICGHISLDSEIRYSSVEGKYLPYVVNLKILEMKSKVILKIEYRAIQIIGKLLEIKIFDVIEMYIFDIQNNNVIWKRYINKKLNDDLEIGYIIDYQKLMENTALWYFNIKHIVRKGTTLSQFLKRLRELVIKKEKNINGYTKKQVYISNISLRHKLFANVLNLAHKVRFWDSPNINYNDSFFYDKYLDKFEKNVYLLMKKDGLSYFKACFKTLSLPYTRNIKKQFDYKYISLLQQIYTIENIDIANTIFKHYKTKIEITDSYIIKEEYLKNIQKEVKAVCFFYKLFILKIYTNLNLKFKQLLENKTNIIIDIMNLWHSANNKTKKNFIRHKIPFSKAHDWLSIEVSKQADQEIRFHISKNIMNRFNLYMMNTKFQCSCINKYSNLKYIARQMKNCSAGYKDRINNQLQLVAISDNTGKPKVLLEINQDSIVQAKLYRNVPVFKDNLLNNLVIEFAKKVKLKIKTDDISIKQDNNLKNIA
ncbi:PcfJ domain-containing protein [Megamonas funiformis]|nr:PcfJ domain-containing protein [Megamonas funiformis]